MRAILVSLIIYLLFISLTVDKELFAQKTMSGQISISGAFALYPMAQKWVDEFNKIYPNIRIDVSAGGAGKGIADALGGMVDIGMVSREIYPAELRKGAYPIAVTKDAVVAVVSAANPGIKDILIKGIKKDVGNNIWITGRYKNWSQAFGIKSTNEIHVYTRSDASGAAEMWAKYYGKKQEDLIGVGVFGDPGLLLAVSKDPLGIGYNNIGYAYDARSKKQQKGIKVVPIDLNNNGKIDPDENFYESMDDLIAAIATAKYPSPPARDLYFVLKGKSTNKAVNEFIKWVLTDGQKFVNQAGYITLSKEKIAAELKKL